MALYLLFLAAFIQLFGASRYIYTMKFGNTKVNRVPWFLVSLSGFVATAAALYEGTRWAILPAFLASFGPFCVFLASFLVPGSLWKSTWFDYFCGALSLLAIAIWIMTRDGTGALILAIFADLCAALPLVSKTWRHPETENISEYAANLLSGFIGLFVIQSYHVTEWGFSVYLIAICSILVFNVKRKAIFGRDNKT